MKITYTDMQNIAKEVIGLADAVTLVKIKRDINIGSGLLLAELGREFNRKERYTDTVANQQYYQLPEDGQKLKEVTVSIGSWNVPMEQISNEREWLKLNMSPNLTGQPTHYFVKGYDQIGFFPIPSSSVENGIMLVLSPKHVQLTQDDYTMGTVTVTNNTQSITGSGTAFTQNMIGLWVQTTDGSDENWYQISDVPDAVTLTIDNFYQGYSGAGKTFRIGQVVDIPEEFSEAPSDYACYRHYLRRGDQQKANTFKAIFEKALQGAKDVYGSVTDNQVISVESDYRYYNPFRGDPPPNGITA